MVIQTHICKQTGYLLHWLMFFIGLIFYFFKRTCAVIQCVDSVSKRSHTCLQVADSVLQAVYSACQRICGFYNLAVCAVELAVYFLYLIYSQSIVSDSCVQFFILFCQNIVRRCCLYIDSVDNIVYFLFKYFMKVTDLEYANKKQHGISLHLRF